MTSMYYTGDKIKTFDSLSSDMFEMLNVKCKHNACLPTDCFIYSLPTDSAFSLENKQGFCLQRIGYHCPSLRWTTNNRLFVPVRKKCLGVQGKTEGSEVNLYDCDENSDLQKWECKNQTIIALKNEDLYINLTGYGSGVLSKAIGSRSHLRIRGGIEGACSRTYRGTVWYLTFISILTLFVTLLVAPLR